MHHILEVNTREERHYVYANDGENSSLKLEVTADKYAIRRIATAIEDALRKERGTT